MIYASHLLEHLPHRSKVGNALREWRRVLRPGGEIMISVSDFEVLCRLFLRLTETGEALPCYLMISAMSA
jgi:predicted SAM-dependent methyltransferase